MEFRDLKKQYEVLQKDMDEAIGKVLRSAAFIQGAPVRELEERLSQYLGVKHCLTCANGTDALELALMAWGIGPGDAVIVPDFTFFSTGEAVSRVGAVPLFADVDPLTFNLDPGALEEVILKAEQEGKHRLRAVIPVDLFGLPADYDRIRPVCERYGLLLLEDGAQGFGGELHGRKACSFGDISITSFFPAKPLGCYGDGGAVFTNDDELARKMRSLMVHGKGSNKYDNVQIGMNSRLDTLQAAVLLVKLDAFIASERASVNRAAETYDNLLQGLGLRLPKVPEGFFSSWAQYTVVLPEGTDREALQEELRASDVPTMIYYYKPMHKQKAFEGTDSARGHFPVSEDLARRVLSLPIDPYKTEEELSKAAETLKNALLGR